MKRVNMVRALTCMLILITMGRNASSQTSIPISASVGDGFVSDANIITENNPFTQLDLKIGKSAVDGSANLTSAIIPFSLPVIPEGEEITDANLRIYVSFGRQWIDDACHVDVYGLPFSASETLNASDHYAGSFGSGNGSDFGIQDDFFQKNVTRGTLDTERFEETSLAANESLVDYLKAQYTAGAVPGDFVFLRLSIDYPEMTGSQYFGVHGGEGTNPAVLTITHSVVENVAPVLSAIGNIDVQSGDDLLINVSASDDNGDAVSFSVTDNLPPSAVFTDNGNATASITITNAGNVATYSDIVVTASDGELTDSETISIDILEPAPNSPPVLLPIEDASIDQYGYARFDFSATDADDDGLTFTITNNLPPSGIFNDNGDGTATLEIISESNLGLYSDIIVSVEDSENTTTESFSINIVSRDENQLMNLDAPSGPRFSITDKTWPAQHGEADVSYWHNDKIGVTTITIDDNIESDHDWWLSMQDKYPSLKFTWFVIESGVSSWGKYQTLINAGHEVNAHDNCDINDGSDKDYRTALQNIQDAINVNTSAKAKTYAYPCGEEDKTHIARDIFIGMRGVFGFPNKVNEINYLALDSRSATNDNNDIDILLDPNVLWGGASYYRGWYSTHYHSISGIQENTEAHLSYINDHSDDVWVAGFSEAMQYGQERDSHSLNVDEVDDFSVKFTLTDQMKDDLFTNSLTVKVRVNNDWKSAIALQNGVVRETDLISNEGNTYVLINAIPDMGQVTLSGSDEETENHAPQLRAVGNQSIYHVDRSSILITAQDINDDLLYFSASEELPPFATFTDNQDGTATLLIQPSVEDVGLYENIKITVSDGLTEDEETIEIDVKNFEGTIRYFDPINGSNTNDGSEQNPWASFSSALSANKVIDDGDLVYLLDGEHGIPSIADKAYVTGVTVKPYLGHTPNMTGLIIARSSNWTFEGIQIDGSASTLQKEGFLVTSDVNSTDLTFRSCLIQSADESSTWTKADWYANSTGGMDMRGDNITVEYTTIKNTYHALSLRGDNSRASHNLIDNFCGDAIRGLGNFSVFEYNIVRDCYVEDYETNHDDAFQTFILTDDPKLEGMIIRSNSFLLFEDPITQFVIDNDLIGESMQGIIITDGYADGWVVENNLLVTDHYHGITLWGARNSRVQNNTVIKHPYFTDEKIPWILVEDSPKTGQGNFDNVIRNNLAADISFADFDNTSIVEGNHQIDASDLANFQDYFENYTEHNYFTNATSPAINVGVNEDLSALDLAGNDRLANGTVDAGAYEFFSEGIPELVPLSDQTMTEGESLTVSLSAVDPNNLVLEFSVSNLPSFGVLTDNGDGTGSIKFDPDMDAEGVFQNIQVQVSNGTETDSDLFTLTVENKVEPPVVEPIADQTMKVGEELTVSVSASDILSITLTTPNIPDFGTFSDHGDGTGSFVFSPQLGDDEVYSDIQLVADNGSLSAETSFNLNVINNAAPVLEDISNVEIEEASQLSFNIMASDADSDVLNFSAANLPSFALLVDNEDNSATLTINPANGDFGLYTGIEVEVSDEVNTVTKSFSITITSNVLSLDDELTTGMSVYPNPSKDGNIFIQLPKAGNQENIDVEIYDLAGARVKRHLSLQPIGGDLYGITKSKELPKGQYLIVVSIKKQRYVGRLIID